MVTGIIGAGASGMAAALAAAENESGQVVLMERQARVGRKLQATGNGRCNLSISTGHPAATTGKIRGLSTMRWESSPQLRRWNGSGVWGFLPWRRIPGGCIPIPIRQIPWWMCCGLRWKSRISR